MLASIKYALPATATASTRQASGRTAGRTAGITLRSCRYSAGPGTAHERPLIARAVISLRNLRANSDWRGRVVANTSRSVAAVLLRITSLLLTCSRGPDRTWAIPPRRRRVIQ